MEFVDEHCRIEKIKLGCLIVTIACKLLLHFVYDDKCQFVYYCRSGKKEGIQLDI